MIPIRSGDYYADTVVLQPLPARKPGAIVRSILPRLDDVPGDPSFEDQVTGVPVPTPEDHQSRPVGPGVQLAVDVAQDDQVVVVGEPGGDPPVDLQPPAIEGLL